MQITAASSTMLRLIIDPASSFALGDRIAQSTLAVVFLRLIGRGFLIEFALFLIMATECGGIRRNRQRIVPAAGAPYTPA